MLLLVLVWVVIVHVSILDLVVVVVEVFLERDLRRVGEGVDSLHFSTIGLHNRP